MGNVNNNANPNNILSVGINNENSVCIPSKIKQIPLNIDTIKFTEDCTIDFKSTIFIKYSQFLSNIATNVKTLIYELNPKLCLEYKDILCTQLPNHIEKLELKIYANTKEIFPQLNNLPLNLKLLKIDNIMYYTRHVSPSSYKFIIQNNDTIYENDLLLKCDIKLPFDCKIELPDNTVHDTVEKLFFKLKYTAPVFSQFGGKKRSKKSSKKYSKPKSSQKKSSKKSSFKKKSSKKSSKKTYQKYY